MNFRLRPETEVRLTALAAASGVSVDDYLAALVGREAPESETASPLEFSGTQFEKEHGIWVYRTGFPMPSLLVEDTLQALRWQREERIIGNIPA